MARELDHVAPAAAARVEDPGARRQAQAGYDPLEYLTASPVPPVPVLRAVCLKLVLPVHPGSIPYGALPSALRRKLTVRSQETRAASGS